MAARVLRDARELMTERWIPLICKGDPEERPPPSEYTSTDADKTYINGTRLDEVGVRRRVELMLDGVLDYLERGDTLTMNLAKVR